MNNHDKTRRAVIRVGSGREFVVRGAGPFGDQLVITAAHCLPFFPPCHGASDRTYKALLGSLGEGPAVWAECLFVDPIGDIAVLGPPDGQELANEWEAYNNLINELPTAPIGDAPPQRGPAWLLSLDNRWFRCDAQHRDGPFWITNAAENIVGGMSGSPIVRSDGSAIGVLCISIEGTNEGGPNPRLGHNLPAWLVRNSRARPARSSARRSFID